jgi:hypothetical protein
MGHSCCLSGKNFEYRVDVSEVINEAYIENVYMKLIIFHAVFYVCICNHIQNKLIYYHPIIYNSPAYITAKRSSVHLSIPPILCLAKGAV